MDIASTTSDSTATSRVTHISQNSTPEQPVSSRRLALCGKASVGSGLIIPSKVEVTILPPGEAEGARDLDDWAVRRKGGQSGVSVSRKERGRLKSSTYDRADRWITRHDKTRR